jgi:hypothetical protein
MMKIFEVKVYVDDGWQRFYTTHKVLADCKIRAVQLAFDYWWKKDSTNIVKLQSVKELENFTEGVIV